MRSGPQRAQLVDAIDMILVSISYSFISSPIHFVDVYQNSWYEWSPSCIECTRSCLLHSSSYLYTLFVFLQLTEEMVEKNKTRKSNEFLNEFFKNSRQALKEVEDSEKEKKMLAKLREVREIWRREYK